MRFLFLTTIFLSIAISLSAGELLAKIIKIEGDVKILRSGEIKKSKAEKNSDLFKDDMVVTEKDSVAVLVFADKSKVVLDEKSKLKIEGFDNLKQDGGKVFYSIKKRGAHGLKVATNFAVIGVKGTKFLVTDDEKSKKISLKSGLIGVQSLKEEFELHRKQEMDEYEAYKAQMRGEFEEYKKKMQEEFVEFVKEFDLKPNKTVSFDGNKVSEDSSPEEIAAEFEKFERY